MLFVAKIDKNFNLFEERKVKITVDAYSSKLAEQLENSDVYGVVAELFDKDNNLLSKNIYRYKKDKEINYPDVEVYIKKIDKCCFELSANNFVRGLYLNPHNNDVVFSDNYFDLLKDETVIVSTNIDIDISDIEIMNVK